MPFLLFLGRYSVTVGPAAHYVSPLYARKPRAQMQSNAPKKKTSHGSITMTFFPCCEWHTSSVVPM